MGDSPFSCLFPRMSDVGSCHLGWWELGIHCHLAVGGLRSYHASRWLGRSAMQGLLDWDEETQAVSRAQDVELLNAQVT